MIHIGSVVRWSYQAGGRFYDKEGIVEEVLSPYTRPDKHSYPSLYSRGRPGAGRDHVSYVVNVDGKHYWPTVSKLSEVKSSPKKKSIAEAVIQAKTQEPEIINLIGFSLDYSASMRSMSAAAMRDFNTNLDVIKQESKRLAQETRVTVNQCSGSSVYSSPNVFLHRGVPSDEVHHLTEYRATGYTTPLYDSIGEIIDLTKYHMRTIPAGTNVSAMVIVITDGQENSSTKWTRASLQEEIINLQKTNNWTFVFRVPRGYMYHVRDLGVPEQNIMEWETTEKGLEYSTRVTASALQSHYQLRSTGATSNSTFYADLSKVSDSTIKGTLNDITKDVWLLPVTEDIAIRPFVERCGMKYSQGKGFYQLTKSEEVQDYKEICVQDKRDGKIYGGRDARDLLNLPHQGYIRLRPGQTGNYDVFVQSTSVNRKLIDGTRLLYKK